MSDEMENNSKQAQKICVQCQKCCNYVTFTITFYSESERQDLIEFYSARGFLIIDNKDSISVVIESKCPQLTIYGCRDYNSRPIACRIYDGRKDPISVIRNMCQLPRDKK